MFDSYTERKWIFENDPAILDYTYRKAAYKLHEELGYDIDVLEKLEDAYTDSFKLYMFLESCKNCKLDSHTIREYLNINLNDEWEQLKNKLEQFNYYEVNEAVITHTDYGYLYQIRKSIKHGSYDYYEKRLYSKLSNEGKKLLVNLLYQQIYLAKCRDEKITYMINLDIIKFRDERKKEAINCGKLLTLLGI